MLDLVLRLRGRSFLMGPIVIGECGPDRHHFEQLIADGRIQLIDEDSVPASAYLLALETHGLGAGETECLIIAAGDGSHVCSDDRAARQVLTRELGSARLTGSLGLLKEATHECLISSDDAWKAYEQMLTRGAFLPQVVRDFFDPK